MRRTTLLSLVLLIFALLALAAGSLAQAKPDGMPYLGQCPPDEIPRVFAPGVVSNGNIHSRLTISPDGRTMLWNTFDLAAVTTQILCVRNIDGKWTRPHPPPFAREGSTRGAMFSPDGKKLFFLVETARGWATKYVVMTDRGWSAPRSDGVLLDCSSSFTRSGRAYFSSEMKSKAWVTGIFSAKITAEGYSDPRPLGASINVPNAIDYTPFVSPDESVLLFSSNRPQAGEKEDMHICASFNLGDGTWSAPKQISSIQARFPSLSPDGRYLFFCGDDGNIYWVDAAVIEPFRPTAKGPGVKR
jgi:Tol biopolymer transport system component